MLRGDKGTYTAHVRKLGVRNSCAGTDVQALRDAHRGAWP